MSLSVWAKAGWLKAHKPTKQQLAAVFAVVDRDLEDSKRNGFEYDAAGRVGVAGAAEVDTRAAPSDESSLLSCAGHGGALGFRSARSISSLLAMAAASE